jgi:hypothetical protein
MNMREMIDAGISLDEILANIKAEYTEAAALKQKEEEEKEREDKLADAKEMLADAMLYYLDAIGLKNYAANTNRETMIKMIEDAEGPLLAVIKLDQIAANIRKQQKEEMEEIRVSMPYDDFFEALDKAGLL